MSFRFIILLSIWLLIGQNGISSGDTLTRNQISKRRTILIGGTSVIAAGSLIYLNQAWYQQYNTGDFHFFDDNSEWLQMDKLGHVFSTYQTGRLMMEAFDWAKYNKTQKLFIGGAMGLYYMTVIECMDGFSEGWGFSWGDMAANVLGSSMAIVQEAVWKEQRIQLKFFYSNSGLSGYNPELLGNDPVSRLIKDYNGQSYWLSVNPSSFINRPSKFPKWLNLAIGYGAYGMIGANNNPVIKDANGNEITIDRYRRYYLSFDLDLTRIKVKSKVLKSLFSIINIIKFPSPTLEYSQGKFQFHTFYP